MKVIIGDLRAATTVEFDVGASDALAAFHHPYVYAPSEVRTTDRGVGTAAHPTTIISVGAHHGWQ